MHFKAMKILDIIKKQKVILQFIFLVTLYVFNFSYANDLQNFDIQKEENIIENEAVDYSKLIKKNKSSVTVGVGLNYTSLSIDSDQKKYEFNASFLVGYSYFFNKNFGLRLYALADNSDKFGLYGIGSDIIYDIYQGNLVGFGAILGLSGGYMVIYPITNEAFLPYVNAGLSISFDSGKNRFELLTRYPLIKPHINNTLVVNQTTFIAMYSYTF